MSKVIAVVDYGMGNLFSVVQALHEAAQRVDGQFSIILAHTPEDIEKADKLILPGQGAMPACMAHIHASGMEAAFMKAFKQKPIFGVCVGQQMLFETSQEGDATCLGVYRGTVDRFPVSDTLKIPHMGWNQVKQLQNHPMWSGIDNFANFYFVHSYYVHPSDTQIILGSTQYGVDFASCVGKDNVFATQFHPEKSGAVGIKLYENFLKWRP